MNLHEIFTRGRYQSINQFIWIRRTRRIIKKTVLKVSRWLHFGGDPNWPSLSFRGHSRQTRSFRHKINRRKGKRYSQSYYRTL